MAAVTALLLVAHLLIPGLAVDTTTLALLTLLIIVALIPFSKAITLPGGGGITFRDLKEAKGAVDKAEGGGKKQISLLRTSPETSPEASPEESMWMYVVDSDPNIGLAGLRIEIERKIRQLTLQIGIPKSESSETLRMLIEKLRNKEVLSFEEMDAILQVTNICNKAVHAQYLDPRDVNLAMELGERVLEIINGKFKD